MKNLIKLFLFVLVLFSGIELLAQVSDPLSPVADLLNSILGKHLATSATFSAFVLGLAATVNKIILRDKLTSFGKVCVAVVIGLALAYGTHFVGIGMFAELTLLNVGKTAIYVVGGATFVWDLINAIMKGGFKIFNKKTDQ